MDLGLPPLRREPTAIPFRYVKPLFERSSVRALIVALVGYTIACLEGSMTWRDAARAAIVQALSTFLTVYMGKDSEGRIDPPTTTTVSPPPSRFALLLLIPFLAVVISCAKPYSPPPGPTPTPTPIPTPGPTPVPVPPPAPVGHVLTPVEYDGIVVGKTQEQAVLAAYGAPWRRSAVGTPGTSALLYFATDPAGGRRIAEVWVRDGLVVNKNRL